jgi:glycosyltransferase involved in cell wall biosynthesis
MKMNKNYSRIKVLHVAPLPPPLGGMVTYIQELLNSNVTKAVDVRVVRFDYLGKEHFSGVFRIMVNYINAMILTLVFISQTILWQPNIIHIQTNSGFGFYEKSWIVLLAKLMKRKTIMHIHGGNFREFYKGSPIVARNFIRWFANLNNRVVVASPQMRDTLLFVGLSDAKITLIGNAVHLPVINKISQSRDVFTILFLTRIVFAKGIIELIDAVRLLHDSFGGVRLRIVGAEELETISIKKYLTKCDALEYIQYIGPVSESQKHDEYTNADIFAFPTHIEDQSYAVMEAMSYALPCVASNVGGVPSLIKDGQNGLLILPKDTNSLISALERFILDDGLRDKLGKAARNTIESDFCWEDCANKIIALYKSIIAE